jgi:hypothetical protein
VVRVHDQHGLPVLQLHLPRLQQISQADGLPSALGPQYRL